MRFKWEDWEIQMAERFPHFATPQVPSGSLCNFFTHMATSKSYTTNKETYNYNKLN